ncbi:hypothetical protein HG537_0D05360 [Torulaspora globosa]|uniref:Ubiquitin-like protease family profile domain-containing protein n=1 Tax=Torulaspora globosa TaxID=48254 RepID=A0A7H9HVQ6_9SACH|nr:hypothetical protein HG537_0D05360 [Torulaspora sp. CBS 2947]
MEFKQDIRACWCCLMRDLGPSDGQCRDMGPGMSRKKLGSGGPGPVNYMNDENRSSTRRPRGGRSKVVSSSNSGPSRYTGARYRSNRELKGGGSIVSLVAAQRGIIAFEKVSENSAAVEHSAAAERPGGGLMGSTGEDCTTVKYSISGELSSLDVHGNADRTVTSVLDFIADSTGPRVQFTLDRREKKETQIDICKDCAEILVDEIHTCLGFVLVTPRRLQLDDRYKVGSEKNTEVAPTTVLQFVTNNYTNKIKMVRERLKSYKKCRVRILPTQEDLKKELRDLSTIELKPIQESSPGVASDTANESRTKFLHKQTYSSLRPRRAHSRLSSPSESASKIVVPSSPERVEPITNISGVPTKAFYNREDSQHAISNLNITRETRSKTTNLSQSKLWNQDDEGELEIPEKFEPQLCYKFDDGASYTITNQDFKCLYNHDWINDTILDFFTKYYVEKAIRNSVVTQEEVYIMSSFFYTKLISDPTDYYGNIKKWVSNSNLFQKKYVVVPININFHWFGCIITNLDSLMEFFEKLDDSEKAKLSSKVTYTSPVTESPRPSPGLTGDIISDLSNRNNTPSTIEEDDEVSVSAPIVKILTFDSLRQTHSREIDPLKDFLIAYAKDKYSIDLDKSLIKMRTCAVPQQPNMSDCGVHVILNTMKFFENPQETIEIWRSAKSRSKVSTKTINEYFERNKRGSARQDLREILWHLQRKQIKLMKENGEAKENNYDIHEQEDEGDLEIIEELSKHAEAQSHQNNQSVDKPNEYNSRQLIQTDSPSATKEYIESSSNTDSQQSAETDKKLLFNEMASESRICNQNKINSAKSTPSLMPPLSDRKYLESSPLKSSNEDTLPETISPYFKTSGSRSGQAANDNENNKRLVSSRSFEEFDNQEAKRRSGPSPAPLEDLVIEKEKSSSLAPGIRTRRSQSSESSVGMVSLCDNTHDDVKLIGDDSFTQVRRNVNSALNDRESDEVIPISSLPTVPLLASYRTKAQSPNESDSDLIDKLSTSHHIQVITSD